MKSDFMLALTQLSAEKNLPAEVVITAVEAALASAYKKDNFGPNQNIDVKINPNSGKVEVWAEKTVVEVPSDRLREIALEEARKTKADIQLDDTIMVESTPDNAGRIAAQTAKQVILQRLNEAEYTAIVEEYTNREGDVVTGIVQRIEAGQIFIDLGRTEGLLPASEQVRSWLTGSSGTCAELFRRKTKASTSGSNRRRMPLPWAATACSWFPTGAL